MSDWVHIAAVVRIDSWRMNGEDEAEEIRNYFGKECLWGGGAWDDYHDHPLDYLPMGSEGTLHISSWTNPNTSLVPAYTITIFGDLRDRSSGQAIIDEREKSGPYKDIFDFVQRINFGQINRKAFEALALSGGFDSFGYRREDFFATNNKGESFIEIVMRYGQLYQMEKQQAQNSLFGAFDELEIQTPTLPKSEERWSDIERLNKERELVGIYLSAHPLDEYKIVLDNLCNTRCDELADVGNLAGREDVTIGGIVTSVRTGFTKTGKPFGIVTLEDFVGSGELALFGEAWGDKSGFFTVGASVYVTGKVKPRFSYNPDGPKDLGITGVEFLQTIKERAIDRITISLTSDLLDDQVVAELGELIEAHPGKTKLFFQLHDLTGKNHVLLKSTSKMVDVKSELIQYENFESLKNGAQPLVVDFWATWCGPCRMIAPVIAELATAYDGKVTVAKCDVEECEDLAAEFGIRNIPTILFFKGGQVVDKLIGAQPKAKIEEKIQALL